MTNQDILQAVPVQICTTDKGTLILRGPSEIKISGPNSTKIVETVLHVCSGEGATSEQILSKFASCDHAGVTQLIDHLIKRRIILVKGESISTSTEDESELDLFYWSFGMETVSIQKQLECTSLAVMGINRISLVMARLLAESQITSWTIVDDPWLRNLRFFKGETVNFDIWDKNLPPIIPLGHWKEQHRDIFDNSCIVATSDFGVSPELVNWNKFCIDQNVTFLPVVLDRLVGHVGPMVTPGETACYECFRLRENANMEDPSLMRLSEANAFDRQSVNALHPAMASMVGDVAIMELVKFFGKLTPPKFRNLIEIRMIPAETKPRWVLKLPWCPACGPLQHKVATNVDRYTYFPDSPLTKAAFQDRESIPQ